MESGEEPTPGRTPVHGGLLPGRWGAQRSHPGSQQATGMCVLALSTAFHYRSLDVSEKRRITAARTSTRGCRWFTFLLLGLSRGSEGRFQIPGAQPSPGVARGSPARGCGLLPPSLVLASRLHSTWQGSGPGPGSPTNSVTLGEFPSTLSRCVLTRRRELATPQLFSQARILRAPPSLTALRAPARIVWEGKLRLGRVQ